MQDDGVFTIKHESWRYLICVDKEGWVYCYRCPRYTAKGHRPWQEVATEDVPKEVINEVALWLLKQ